MVGAARSHGRRAGVTAAAAAARGHRRAEAAARARGRRGLGCPDHEPERPEELAERRGREWGAFAAALRASARVPGGDFAAPRRPGRLDELPFRAYGALLGARVGGSRDLAETAAGAARDAARAELAGLGEVSSAAPRSDGLTAINRVMLASALDPLAFRRLEDEPCIL